MRRRSSLECHVKWNAIRSPGGIPPPVARRSGVFVQMRTIQIAQRGAATARHVLRSARFGTMYKAVPAAHGSQRECHGRLDSVSGSPGACAQSAVTRLDLDREGGTVEFLTIL